MDVENKKILFGFGVLSFIYILETLLIPPDSASLTKFQLSEAEVKLLSLTVTLPIIAIWMIGAYVYLKFKVYTRHISDYKDGKAFEIIRLGLLSLFLWLPLSVIFSNFTTYLYRTHESWTAPLVIVNNYLNLILVLIGFTLIFKGCSELLNLKEIKKSSLWRYSAFVPLIGFSGLFIYLSLNNPVRQFPSEEVPVAGFYLPDWLLVGTIIIPYILVFYFGIFSTVYLYIYRKKVRGFIYKEALDYLAKGLICIVLSIIFIRYLASLSTAFNEATLKIILLAIYLLIGFLLLGFILLAKSVRKLEAIEKA